MKIPELKGKNITLTEVRISDAPYLVKSFNESKHLIGRPFQPDMNVQSEKDFILRQNSSDENYFFAIRLVESGNIIGTISLKINDKNDETATTGTMIGKEYTNHGYGTEAKHLLLAYVFDHLFLRKIYSEVFSYNPTSKAYSLKCGYVHEATLIKDKFFEGKYWDKWILSITKKQWFPVWETYKAKNQP